MQLDYIRVGEGMKTRKTEQNARKNYKKVYFLMIVASTILFLTAIGCQKKVDTSLKAQPSIVEYTCISDSDSDKSFYVILKNYHGVYWETVIEGVSKAANEIDASVYLGGIDNETDIEGQIKLIDEAIELIKTEVRIVNLHIKYPEQFQQHANKLFLSPLQLADKTSLINIMEIVSGLFLSKRIN